MLYYVFVFAALTVKTGSGFAVNRGNNQFNKAATKKIMFPLQNRVAVASKAIKDNNEPDRFNEWSNQSSQRGWKRPDSFQKENNQDTLSHDQEQFYDEEQKGKEVDVDAYFLIAVEKNQVKEVELFLYHGVDINVRNSNGETALIIAAKNGYELIAKMLLNANAKIDLENDLGCTAMVYATIQKYSSIAIDLLDRIDNKNEKNYQGQVLVVLSELSQNFELKNEIQQRNIVLEVKSGAGVQAFDYFNKCR